MRKKYASSHQSLPVDKRNPSPTNETTTKVMRSNKGRGTNPELILRKALRETGYPGYRLNWKKAPGRPDITYPGRRVAIFVNGCFWHRCPHCDLPLPKSHTDFWQQKFERNMERDKKKTKELEDLGWKVVTIWECEIRKNLPSVISSLKKILECGPDNVP